MNIMAILNGILQDSKKIEVNKLPSQGLFYKKDFSLKIKKAEVEDIIEYEFNFDPDDLIRSIECIKKIVRKNVILGNGYKYEDIKSVDIIFIFLEIVKFTNSADINIEYIDSLGQEGVIKFDSDNFNYFDFEPFKDSYDEDNREMNIKGYKFSLPSIGVESCLTKFLSSKSTVEEVKKLSKVNYDFMFFLGVRDYLSFDEIENLIEIFNSDLDESEIEKVRSIVNTFKDIVGYTLLSDGRSIEIKTKINLKEIWKTGY